MSLMEKRFRTYFFSLCPELVRDICRLGGEWTSKVRWEWVVFAHWYCRFIGKQDAESIQRVLAWVTKRRCMVRFREAIYNDRIPMMIWEQYILKDKAI